PPKRPLPKVEMPGDNFLLRFGQAGRIVEPDIRNLTQCPGCLSDFGGSRIRPGLRVCPFKKLGHHLAALLKQLEQVQCEFLWIFDLQRCALWPSFWIGLLHGPPVVLGLPPRIRTSSLLEMSLLKRSQDFVTLT